MLSSGRSRADIQRTALAFSAIVEAATGVALIVDPATVARLLLGTTLVDVAAVMGRCFGVGLVALALACWPPRQRSGEGAEIAAARRAMLTYGVLIAAYLAYLGMRGVARGAMLWPAVGLHAAVALFLLFPGSSRS